MRKPWLVLFVVVAIAIAAYAKQTKILYYGDVGSLQAISPLSPSPLERRISQFIFDSLVHENTDGKYTFSLAESVDVSPDGLAYTFILRDNLKWQDGTPLTARDVEFTLELLLNPQTENYFATLAKFIEDVGFINPRALTITLSQPFYRPLSLFTFAILPKHKFTTNYLQRSHIFTKNPIGCGPFRYAKGIGGDTLVLVRNKHCQYRRSAFIEKIVVRIYDDRRQALADFSKGKLHLIADLSFTDIASLDQQGVPFVVKNYSSRSIHFIKWNYHPNHRYRTFFANSEFRRALLQVLDRHTILQECFYGGVKKTESYTLLSGPFPANSWAYDQQIEVWPHDLLESERIFSEVFNKNGYSHDGQGFWSINGERFHLQMHYPESQNNIFLVCQKIASSLQKMGIQITLHKLSTTSPASYDLLYTQQIYETPLDVFSIFNLEELGKEGINVDNYRDPKLVELLSQLQTTLNPWSMRSICHEIHKISHADTIHLFLWQLDEYVIHRRELKNVKIHPYRFFSLPETWKIIYD